MGCILDNLHLDFTSNFQEIWSVVFVHNLLSSTTLVVEPGTSGGIATGYGLDGLGIESRCGTRFSEPVQTDPGAHPVSCRMGTRSSPGVNSGRIVTLTTNPVLVPWSRKSTAIPLLSPMGRTVWTEPQCLYSTAIPLLSPMGRMVCTEPQCMYKGAL